MPAPQGMPLPHIGSDEEEPDLTNPADINLFTGAVAAVLPGAIPARSQSSPHVDKRSLILWLTSTVRLLASQ